MKRNIANVKVLRSIFLRSILFVLLLNSSGLAADSDLLILRNKPKENPVQIPNLPNSNLPNTQAPNTILVPPATVQTPTQIIIPEQNSPAPTPNNPTPDNNLTPNPIIIDLNKAQEQPGSSPFTPITPVQTPKVTEPDPKKEPASVPVIIIPEKVEPKPEEPKPNLKDEPTPKILTPADFLLKTPYQLEKQPTEQAKIPPKEPAKLAEKPKPEPKAKPAPPVKPMPPKPGDPLRIPETAKVDKNLDFLEGCWVGTRPEYVTKRIIKEQFCFDANGIGKRRIFDPRAAGMCVGPTKATIQNNGVLQMNSGVMACDRGDGWAASTMTCEGQGKKTPCTWVFRNDKGQAEGSQSYTINFVRE